MSANLNESESGEVSFAWSKKALARPWHGTGTPCDEWMSADDALAASKTDWRVGLDAIYHHSIYGQAPTVGMGSAMKKIDSHRAIVRLDTGDVLGVATPRYAPIQNREAAEALEGLIKDGLIGFETMGALGKGETFFAAAKILHVPEGVTVAGETMERHIMLLSAHDGSSSAIFKPTVTLPVCQNTVTIALAEKSQRIARVKHTGAAVARLALIPEQLGVVDERVVEFAKLGDRLALVKISHETFVTFARELLFPGRGPETMSTRGRRMIDSLVNCYLSGPGQEQDNRASTAWGAFNAVTAFNAHVAKINEGSSRMLHVLSGRGDAMNRRALSLLTELVPA